VSIGYGVTPEEGGEQPRYLAASPSSITRWGHYAYTAATELAALSDAQAMGDLLLTRNSSPVWVMAALPVDTAGLDDDRYAALLLLDVHSLVTLTGLPSLGTAPTSSTLWVEGYAETLSHGRHEIEVVVSGYCRTTPPPRWDDVPPGVRWGGTSRTLARTNLSTNPTANGAASGWRANDGASHAVAKAIAPPIAHPLGITTTAKVTALAPMVGTTVACSIYAVDGDAAPTGTSRGVGVWVLAPWPVEVRLYMTTDQAITDKRTRIPANVWTYCTMAAPGVGISIALVYRVDGAVVALNDAVWLTGSIAEAAVVPGDYFDGNTPDTAGLDYAWTGANGGSTSTATALAEISPAPDPSVTWDDAACLGPTSNYGRWDDQPASLRWDAVDPALTWDTYGNG
jgi:hypothetical protein